MLVERHADLQVARDYAQLSNAALGDGSPTPQHWPTVEEWAGALDPGSSAPPSVACRVCARWARRPSRATPGALIETKGVVASPRRRQLQRQPHLQPAPAHHPKEIQERYDELRPLLGAPGW